MKRAQPKPAKSTARVASYVISLPERVVRSAAALAGGLIREIGDVSRSVRGAPHQDVPDDGGHRAALHDRAGGRGEGRVSVRRRAGERFSGCAVRPGMASSWLGLLAFRASPVWIMAALADVSGAGRHIVQEIADALKQEGLLAGDAKFENVDQLLEGPGADRRPGGRSVQRAAAGRCGPAPRVGRLFRAAVAKIPPRNLAFGGVPSRALGRAEGGGGGAKSPGVRVVVRSWRSRPSRASR